MFCTKCGTALTEGVDLCPQCGTAPMKADNLNPSEAQSGIAAAPTPPTDSGNFQSFLNFDFMITPTIMKIIYIVGSVVIAIFAFVGLFSGQTILAAVSIFGGAFALVMFRMLCEINMLFFKMHESIKQIQNNTEKE